MARKLKPDEAEIFDGGAESFQAPSAPEEFVQRLRERQEDPLELTFAPEMWLAGFPRKPLGP
jgi:hypothetical protein